ncbi:MAG: porin [Rugosibacter sp.]|jgi:hypothetical protein
MVHNKTLMACAISSLLATPAFAVDYKLSGFGTVAATHFSRDDIDFIGSSQAPNGAGRTNKTSFAPDSKVGLQLNVTATEKLEATLQVLTQHNERNNWDPSVEWANLKYKFNDTYALRVGRIGHPFFMVSDFRNVGYAQTALRPSVEVYGQMPLTYTDVVEGLANYPVWGGQLSLQGGFGKADRKVQQHSPDRDYENLRIRRLAYINAVYEAGALRMNAGRSNTKVFYDLQSFRTGVFDTLSSLGATGQGIRDQYEVKDAKSSFTSLGVSYDPGNFVVYGEYVMLRSEKAYNDSDAWNVFGGYRIGKFTPYVSYAKSKTKNQVVVSGVATALGGGLMAQGLEGALAQFANATVKDQATASVGVRWDFYKNLALKAQYDHITPKAPSESGMLVNSDGTYPTRASGNAVAVSLDFVF